MYRLPNRSGYNFAVAGKRGCGQIEGFPACQEAKEMKVAKDGWVLLNERSDAPRAEQRFAAQPKIYFNDGTAQLLHVHSGGTKEEAQHKAQLELEAYMAQHS